MGIAANLRLTVFEGSVIDAYAHSPAPNDTYLAKDDVYNNFHKENFGMEVNRRYVSPKYRSLQGHPE